MEKPLQRCNFVSCEISANLCLQIWTRMKVGIKKNRPVMTLNTIKYIDEILNNNIKPNLNNVSELRHKALYW